MNGMGQIATLADRLSTMSDQMLPQLAQQYKDDAITLSLILNEKNRRDRVRQTAQANPQQAMQQPKVNDQVVASMQPQQLPEDVGIGTLPTPNIDNMAAGGLVAFADGGDVERYYGVGSIPPSTGTEYAIPGMTQGAQRFIPQSDPDPETPFLRRLWNQIADVGERERLVNARIRVANGRASEEDKQLVAQADAMSKEVPYKMPASLPESFDRYKAKPGTPEAALQPAAPPATAPSGPSQRSADRNRVQPRPPQVGSSLAKPGQGADVFSVEGLKNIQNQLSGDSAYQVGEMRNQIVGMNAEDERQAEERLAAERKRQAAEGDVYKGRGERIAAREAALGKQGEENKGLAFLNAGLAIMASRGPVGEAIGKGAQIGTAQYASGIEKLRIAQERLEEAKDRTEELRLNRSDMNQKEIRTLERERDQAVLRGKKALYDFASNRYNLDRATTDKLVSSLISANTTKYAADTQAGATIDAARIRADADKESMLELRGGTLVNNARKNLRDTLVKKYPYADEATINRLFETEWQKELQNNPALAKYAAESTTGGGRASSADPLGLR